MLRFILCIFGVYFYFCFTSHSESLEAQSCLLFILCFLELHYWRQFFWHKYIHLWADFPETLMSYGFKTSKKRGSTTYVHKCYQNFCHFAHVKYFSVLLIKVKGAPKLHKLWTPWKRRFVYIICWLISPIGVLVLYRFTFFILHPFHVESTKFTPKRWPALVSWYLPPMKCCYVDHQESYHWSWP